MCWPRRKVYRATSVRADECGQVITVRTKAGEMIFTISGQPIYDTETQQLHTLAEDRGRVFVRTFSLAEVFQRANPPSGEFDA